MEDREEKREETDKRGESGGSAETVGKKLKQWQKLISVNPSCSLQAPLLDEMPKF